MLPLRSAVDTADGFELEGGTGGIGLQASAVECAAKGGSTKTLGNGTEGGAALADEAIGGVRQNEGSPTKARGREILVIARVLHGGRSGDATSGDFGITARGSHGEFCCAEYRSVAEGAADIPALVGAIAFLGVADEGAGTQLGVGGWREQQRMQEKTPDGEQATAPAQEIHPVLHFAFLLRRAAIGS